ncbi:hypothetical protein, partial [Corynebacterium sp.]|uniref:hypothetical protein n=1 Tax=Corynebacterium sp. TaxID=1720 RepID=UPI0026E0A200
PLTLVAACGSGEEATTPTTSAPPSTVTSTSSAAPTTSEEETSTSEETTATTETTETTEAPEPSPEAAPEPVDPLPEEHEEPAPLIGGQDANDAQRGEIEQLVRGIYEVDTFHQWLRYVPDNTCNELLSVQGGAQGMDLGGIPDSRLADMPQYVNANAHIRSITDVKVEGNRASAVVTAVSEGNAETRTQRYLYEDGRWKFCS